MWEWIAISLLGALLLDREKKQQENLYVWRVENEDGLGPYTEGAMASLRDEELDEDEQEDLDEDPLRPSPTLDFENSVFSLVVARARERHEAFVEGRRAPPPLLFGFRSEDDAETWFGPWLSDLALDGYRIVRVRARRVWISRTARQVLFEPYDERE